MTPWEEALAKARVKHSHIVVWNNAWNWLGDNDFNHIIFWDDITTATDLSQSDTIFFTSPEHPIAIGKKVFWQDCNLYDIIRKFAEENPSEFIQLT